MISGEQKLIGCDSKILEICKYVDKKWGSCNITSGKRSIEDNERIYKQAFGTNPVTRNGITKQRWEWFIVRNSFHLSGEAVDVIVKDIHPCKVFADLLLHLNDLSIGGLAINIFHNFLHIDIRKNPGFLAEGFYIKDGRSFWQKRKI